MSDDDLIRDLEYISQAEIRWGHYGMTQATGKLVGQAARQALKIVQRHAKLVEAIKVLKDWVDLPHSDENHAD